LNPSVRDLRLALDRLSLHLIATKDEQMSKLFSDINLAVHEVEGDMLKLREDGWRKTDALEKAQTVIIKMSKDVSTSKLNIIEYGLAEDSLHLG
jgi:hypothetical protein